MIDEMGQADAVFICSGVGYTESELGRQKQKEKIDVNVLGFAVCANLFLDHFVQNGRGHLVGISSIAALRGSGSGALCSASKAFVSNYIKGLRRKMKSTGADIVVTEIQPGFVNTTLAKGERLFWAASPEKAAEQILKAVRKKKKHAYISKRWRIMPGF
ncbi:SDR family NAD(P)-dependent oxidoreductase [Bacillus glycinifermentans]|uniref:SDR family NAD(P)-dependent oxidoreductase n=1 Tax=Bacillus glycinifermentans TaxID=1664069 RepID=UPI0020C1A8A5|nr:SDR family NAD(P)-dependent oxidoreductase [Bacillus glycinifermentans]